MDVDLQAAPLLSLSLAPGARPPYRVRVMTGRSHLLVAAAGYLAIAAAAPGALGHLAPAQLAAGTVCAAGMSMLPDLDCPGSTIARTLGPLSDLLARLVSCVSGGHRSGTHSLLAWLAVTIGLTLALDSRHALAVALTISALACALAARVLAGAHARAGAVPSLVVGAALALVVGHPDRWLPGAALIAYGSHLLCDLVTTEGVPLLWPLSSRRQHVALIGPSDRRRERLVRLAAGALGAYLALTLIAAPALAAAVV